MKQDCKHINLLENNDILYSREICIHLGEVLANENN